MIHCSVLLEIKRLLPCLVHQISKLFDISPLILNIPDETIEYIIIYIYSLIYDDLPNSDNDILRRAYPIKYYVKFGESIAISTEDSLHVLTLTMLTAAHISTITNQNHIKIITTLAPPNGIKNIYLNQSLDIINKNNTNTSTEQLNNIYQCQIESSLYTIILIGALITSNKNRAVLNFLNYYANTIISSTCQIQNNIINAPIYNNTTNKNQLHIYSKNYNNINTYSKLIKLNITRSIIQSLYYQSITSLQNIKKLDCNINTLSIFTHFTSIN